MKLNLFTFFALALTVLATACSSGGGGSGKNNANGGGDGPGTAMPAGATRPDSITKQPWCTNNVEKGFQLRLSFFGNGNVTADAFALVNGNARGQLLKSMNGTWYVVNNNAMTYSIDGHSTTESIRFDPESPTGAPQLTFTSADGQTAVAYDPCN